MTGGSKLNVSAFFKGSQCHVGSGDDVFTGYLFSEYFLKSGFMVEGERASKMKRHKL